MIGKIEKVLIRDVWKNEAREFTNWLFDNIEVLAEELDVSLSSIDKEKAVGSFSADIIAEDTMGNSVLIENQLAKTDHDHLGKILTYVSNLEAKTAIWISSDPRPEHERAIEWLNEAGLDVDFYLVKIEVYRIGESEPAPKFTIISGPSEKSKVVGKEKKELAERHKKRLDFWKMLLERSKERTTLFSNVSPNIYSWIGTGAGKSGLNFNYVITNKYGQVELYIDRGKGSEEENKKIFEQLYEKKDEIEKSFPFGEQLNWQRLDDRRASRICKTFEYAGLNDKESWEKLQDDMIDSMIEFHKAFKKHIKNLKI